MPPIKLAKSPLGIISLFVVLIEAIAAGMVSFANLCGNPQITFILVLFVVFFPVLVFGSFFYLVINHHTKLYSPSDFLNPDDFTDLVRDSSNKIADLNAFGRVDIRSPIRSAQTLPPEQRKTVERAIADVEPVLESFSAYSFETLHSWYNSINRHDLALLCVNIAIAKSATSENLAFRSASLRKLGRFSEALHSAIAATELDSNNIDAYYNLVIIYVSMKNFSKAQEAYKVVLASKMRDYIQKLNERFDTSNWN